MSEVQYLTGPFVFLVQGPVDNFVHNRKSESPAFYPVFIVMLLQQLNDTTFTHTRLTALFRDYPGEPVPER